MEKCWTVCACTDLLMQMHVLTQRYVHGTSMLHFQYHMDFKIPPACILEVRTEYRLKFLGFKHKKYSLKV